MQLYLWCSTQEGNALKASIPKLFYPGVPYKLVDGESLCCEARVADVAQNMVGKWQCRSTPYACGKFVAQDGLRSHVAARVLKLNATNPSHASEPCGFCGDNTSGCIPMVTETHAVTLKKCAVQLKPVRVAVN